jgi:hypothetical protein
MGCAEEKANVDTVGKANEWAGRLWVHAKNNDTPTANHRNTI